MTVNDLARAPSFFTYEYNYVYYIVEFFPIRYTSQNIALYLLFINFHRKPKTKENVTIEEKKFCEINLYDGNNNHNIIKILSDLGTF